MWTYSYVNKWQTQVYINTSCSNIIEQIGPHICVLIYKILLLDKDMVFGQFQQSYRKKICSQKSAQK